MGSPEEMLLFMVSAGNIEAVQALVKKNVNINYRNREGITPLLGASERGDVRMTKLLLNHGADCNVRGRLTEMHFAMGIPRDGQNLEWTALINAAMFGHEDIVKLLIEHGAEVNFRDINGRSALSAALQQSKIKCAEILIENGADFSHVDFVTASVTCPSLDLRKLSNEAKKSQIKNQNLPILHPAAYDGDRERLQELIKRGASLNLKDKSGDTALHITVENGYFGCAELLIKKGADLNIQGKHKRTPLHIAAAQGFNRIIPSLVENGAIVDVKDEDEITPLHFAVFNSFPLCVKQLLNYGASVNSTFADGKTALHVAVSKSPDCIELLMKENADIFANDDMDVSPLELAIELGLNIFKIIFPGKYNVSSADGTTPLHIAARCSKCECLQQMINDGCDVNVVNNHGDTPLHIACSGAGIIRNVLHESVDSEAQQNIELLIKAGADVNKKNNIGMSPIHVCAKNGLIAPLKKLKKFGAEVNSPCGVKKQTPLQYAAEVGSLNCIKYLIQKGVDKNVTNSENCTALMLAAKNNHFICVKFLLQNDVPLWIS